MKIHPRLVTLIYVVIILFIAIILKAILNINIFAKKEFFIIYVVVAFIISLLSWIKYNK